MNTFQADKALHNLDEIERLAFEESLPELVKRSERLRDDGHGDIVTFSRKVFIPLTRLCRDVCNYCTFARGPKPGRSAYLTPEEVLEIAETGRRQGCKEALFTLGDRPELRYEAARTALRELGYETTVDYLCSVAAQVLAATGLLPHINGGVFNRGELSKLRQVAPSMGLMLESSARRLCERGGPHFGSPDKDPSVRLECIRFAGELQIPFTSGLLIGIGETRQERWESLLDLATLQQQYGHLQEIIVQNFVPKADIKMRDHKGPPLQEILWTVAVARLVFGPSMSLQTPPNLNRGSLAELLAAGINDWGGVSPVTPDFVNPESPWPQLSSLARETKTAGKLLVERLTIYPSFVRGRKRWLDPSLHRAVLALADSDGLAREGNWAAGGLLAPPVRVISTRPQARSGLNQILKRAGKGEALDARELLVLFRARGDAAEEVYQAADQLRQDSCGESVTYVINRNINYTNVCSYACTFCAFSKGAATKSSPERAYVVSLEEIGRRTREAVANGATEVCMQGGIHPRFTGATYLEICKTAVTAAPGIHVHAFSPLEVVHGARTLGVSVRRFLSELKDAGLGSLPGTAAEILDDHVRAVLCPGKISSGEWLTVMETAHSIGLPTTSTIMFGHMEDLESWASHLLKIRRLQERTGGFTEFVPLPFVHMEAPLYRRGLARPGPTFREALLMHAVARLALYPHVTNIQVSWPKLGAIGAQQCLLAGANDLGGALINESISRAAGARHGQCLSPRAMHQLIHEIGRVPEQRTTLYQRLHMRPQTSVEEFSISPVINCPARDYRHE